VAMSASRVMKWGVATVLLVAVTAFAYAGVAGAQAPSGGAWWHASGPSYNVTFTETGLAPGTNWSVHVTGVHWGWWFVSHHQHGSNTSSIVFSLPNGTYRFSVRNVPGYQLLSGAHGVFQVNGTSPPAMSVAFGKLTYYTVTFTESGLASGTHWAVRIATFGHGWGWHFRDYGRSGTGSSLNFSLLNGTYFYRVLSVPGYNLTSGNAVGEFNVTGASPTPIHVTFAALPTYAVTFTETGLPSGTNWSVSIFTWHGVVVTGRSNTPTITLELWNGTYLYHIGHVHGYYVNGSAFGVLTVSGASPPTIDVQFLAWTSGGEVPVAAVATAPAAA